MVNRGFILYSIDQHGHLTGRYTNEHEHGVFYRETARKITTNRMQEIVGRYQSEYNDDENTQRRAALNIVRTNENEFELRWVEEGTGKIYAGVGYQIDGRFVVQYWSN